MVQICPNIFHKMLTLLQIFFDGKTAVTEEQLLDLCQEMSNGLKRPWNPVKPDESLYNFGSISHQSLLFEERIYQYEGFW